MRKKSDLFKMNIIKVKSLEEGAFKIGKLFSVDYVAEAENVTVWQVVRWLFDEMRTTYEIDGQLYLHKYTYEDFWNRKSKFRDDSGGSVEVENI